MRGCAHEDVERQSTALVVVDDLEHVGVVYKTRAKSIHGRFQHNPAQKVASVAVVGGHGNLWVFSLKSNHRVHQIPED